MITIQVNEETGKVEGYISTSEAAEKWHTTVNTVITWNRRGKIPGAIKVGYEIFIPADAEIPPKHIGRPKKVK